MTLELPHSGSGATAYYRTFPSRSIARWIVDGLHQGGVVVDAGAHVGVYTLVAARRVGRTGLVHAIEPQAEVAAALERNAKINDLVNVRVHRLALGSEDGRVGLKVDPRSLGAFTRLRIRPGEPAVQAATLESFVSGQRLERVDLLKVDTAGNEHDVLLGGLSILDRVDRVICKLYNPSVIGERFGTSVDPATTVDLLHAAGFRVVLGDARPADGAALARSLPPGTYSVPVLATRPGTGRR
jgi:FkbM family methyltransferase